MERIKTFIAHARRDEEGQWHEHLLADHLKKVAKRTSEFAEVFKSSDWGHVAGLWHDLGKYSTDFQKYIRDKSGYERESAHIEGATDRVDHSTAGALYACKQFGNAGNILAYLIAGHHAGLPDGNGGQSSLFERLEKGRGTKALLEKALENLPPESILTYPKPKNIPPQSFPSLWMRMLFSCLVDADFLDTESFMDEGKSYIRKEGGETSLNELRSIFTEHMKVFQESAEDTKVNVLRRKILQQAIDKSTLSSGNFSLTVPTGGGKTLTGMAFALNHAIYHQKKRIIYVIPYTSIIEQTAEIFKSIFGEEYVIEHHSSMDIDAAQETSKSRLACENWDAPIIVTTNVQFFESLFAARTSRVRKLHNICNSVVILDEAQLLPPRFLQPIMDTMNYLTEDYGVSFVLSTATQPALNDNASYKFKGLKNVRELMDNPQDLYEKLKRVDIVLPADWNARKTWEELANELKTHPTVLCIVNTRSDCRELVSLLPNAIHLSALMCAKHRSRVIARIKEMLKRKEPIQVISTQLVEAGVDIDFPIVYRAMAGLDSIAQAAGRCNREGKLLEGQKGKVVVFVPPKSPSLDVLKKAEQAAKGVLYQLDGDPLTPVQFKKYFEKLYWQIQNLDEHDICGDLRSCPVNGIKFRSAAEKFKLIEDAGRSVIVLYEKNDGLIGELKKDGPKRWLMRKLQSYTITIYQDEHQRLLAQKDIEEIYPGIFVQVTPALYDEVLGFVSDRNMEWEPVRLVI